MAALEVALRYASLTTSQVNLASKLIVAFMIISLSLVTSSIAVRMMCPMRRRRTWGSRCQGFRAR